MLHKTNSGNTSGCVGVHYGLRTKRWHSYMEVKGKMVHRGTHKLFRLAKAARKAAEYKHYGETIPE